MNQSQTAAAPQAGAYLAKAGQPPVSVPVVVQVKVKSVYGNPKIYPVNEPARLFAQIAGTATLSNSVLACAERLGFTIEQVDAYALTPSGGDQFGPVETSNWPMPAARGRA